MIDILNKEDINQINNYVDYIKNNNTNKLLLSIPDNISLSITLDRIFNNFNKGNYIPINIDTYNKKIKILSNINNFIVIEDVLTLIDNISLDEYKKFIDKLSSLKCRKRNIIIIMSLFKNNKNVDKYKETLENIADYKIDIDKPNSDTINRILNNCKAKLKTLKLVDLFELSDCFKGCSLEIILNVLNQVETDFNKGLIKDLSYKTYYPYIVKFNNFGKYNELNEYDKKIIAYHEIGHFISDYVLNNNLGIISIGGYGDDLGHYKSQQIDDNRIINLDKVKNEIIVCLSGKACTDVLLKDTYSGSNDDVERSRYLYRMLSESAMLGFDKLPPLSSTVNETIYNDKYYISETKFLDDCLKEAQSIVFDNKDKIEEIYTELIKTNILFKQDLKEIMER